MLGSFEHDFQIQYRLTVAHQIESPKIEPKRSQFLTCVPPPVTLSKDKPPAVPNVSHVDTDQPHHPHAPTDQSQDTASPQLQTDPTVVSFPQQPAAAAPTATNAPSTVSVGQNQLARGTASAFEAGSRSAQHRTSHIGRDSDESDSEESTERYDVLMKDTKADSIFFFLERLVSATAERMPDWRGSPTVPREEACERSFPV